MRRAAKRDANEPSIRDALHDAGYWTAQVSHPGVPDLIVGRKHKRTILLFEVKDGNGQLTSDQLQFWQMSEGAYRFVIRSPEEAVRVADTWIGRVNGSSGGSHG